MDIIDCEEKAYSYGFFWANGCINRYKTFTVRLQEQDFDILDFFKNYFGGVRSKPQSKRKDGRIYIQESWIIHDMVWIDKLKRIGFRNTIECIPDHLLHHFLRGLLDGDGHYSYRKNGKMAHITISSNYDDDFEWLIHRLNIPYIVSKHIAKTGKSSTLYLKGGNVLISNFIRYLYKDANIFMKRKYEKNLTILQQ